MKQFIRVFEVMETQVALVKDVRMSQDRRDFRYVITACSPFPHPEDKKIIFNQLFQVEMPCIDAADQELKFQRYTADDAAKFVTELQRQYKKIMHSTGGRAGTIIQPGDIGFKLPMA